MSYLTTYNKTMLALGGVWNILDLLLDNFRFLKKKMLMFICIPECRIVRIKLQKDNEDEDGNNDKYYHI
ncbi:hypothetical protein V1478_007267 [Vespula squamosa]|uniref:Uncharacterized protein n=1 Tax=Vespula squamosa TaxID=30214 RepID=A0ABD2B2N1_VESSQ